MTADLEMRFVVFIKLAKPILQTKTNEQDSTRFQFRE